MASKVLYPPIIDAYMPAFQAGTASKCRVYFSLSKFNSSADFSSVHVSINKQNTGMNVVNTTDNPGINHYRATGIIINTKAIKVEDQDNLYYFDIVNDDLSSIDNTIGSGYKGWIPGWIYKIQIRLSAKDYDGSIGQAAWLNNNAAYFSEWSTICTVKAIGLMDLIIPPIDYDSTDDESSFSELKTLYMSTLDFFGHIESEDTSEVLYKYNVKLYTADRDRLLEDSGELYSNQFQNMNEFKYLFKYEFQDQVEYGLSFSYETNNGFKQNLDMQFIASLIQIDRINCSVFCVENDTEGIMKDLTSVHEEEEEGRVGLKLFSSNTDAYSGNICIRRASMKDKFQHWEDIKIFIVKQKVINDLPIIYDYTIESGVWYRYGVQSIDKDGNRGILVQSKPVMRNFNYSYLLGENNQQLKLQFNNTMNSYKHQKMEGKTEPIGNKYSIITRNGALDYKLFPINGLISFWMDENHLFCNKKVIYKYDDVVDLYENYNEENGIIQYDYIYERDFRQLVLDFLYDGKPKLFKSPTEGNVIVRLMEINCTPNQSLDRMIYEFTSTANEIADNTVANYLKYNFLDPGEWGSEFAVAETRLGQIQMTFTPTTNVFQEIYKKYDSQGKNLGGYTKTLVNISHVKITIEDKPFRILNSAGEYVVGNNFVVNGTQITIYNPYGIYEFDERLTFTARDTLYLLGDAEGKDTEINATIDFLYNLKSEVYQEKKVQSREIKTGMAQIFGEYQPGTSIYREIYYKYYAEIGLLFRRLNKIHSIEIEANPGTVFLIQDDADLSPEEHEINDTGTLRFIELNTLKQLKYLGVRNKETGEIESKPADVLINYYYSAIKGLYKENQ